MRKKQETILYIKLTEFVKNKLTYYINNKLWTATEIACEIGSHSSRISEIRNGSRMVSRSIFRNLLKSGFFDKDDIIHEVVLNYEETEYINGV